MLPLRRGYRKSGGWLFWKNLLEDTDAMRDMVKKYAMYSLRFKGKRYAIGNKLDFLKTNIIYGLVHEKTGDPLRKWLKYFLKEL